MMQRGSFAGARRHPIDETKPDPAPSDWVPGQAIVLV
jgi:hypothetical protein